MAYLDNYDENNHEQQKNRVPTKLILGIVIGLAIISVAVFFAIDMYRHAEPIPDQKTDFETVSVENPDEKHSETVTEISEPNAEQPTKTEVPLDSEPSEPTSEDVSSENQSELSPEEVDKPEYKSSAIPAEQKMPPENRAINDSTEAKYEQFGALNVDKMKDVATKWTTEWITMVNDSRWDEHSQVLKSMLDQNYVKNHSTEYQVLWLYQCLNDSLYVSNESMFFKEVSEVNVTNSVPSPLAYMTINVTAVQDRSIYGEDDAVERTIKYKMAINKDYQVCRFAVAY